MKVAFLGYFRTSFLRPFIPDITDEDELRYPGMGGHGVTDLAIELLRAGTDLTIVTLDPESDTIRRWSHNAVSYIIVPMRRKNVLRDFFRREVELLLQVLRKESPDIVHAHWTNAFALAALNSQLPHIITLHDHPWDAVQYGGIHQLPIYLIALYTYRKAHTLTAVAPSVAEYAMRHGAKNVQVIPNILTQKFLDRPPVDVRQTDSPVITSVLNWNKLKNPHSAIQAFAGILDQFPKARLHLFGLGMGPGERCEQWAQNHDWDRNVVFEGMVENELLRRNLQRSTILLHTSRSESTSMAIAEAMATGIPVIAGKNARAVPWILDNGGCGALVDVNEPDEVRDVLVRLLSDVESRRAYARKARIRAEQLFDPQQGVASYQFLYNSILNKQGRNVP